MKISRPDYQTNKKVFRIDDSDSHWFVADSALNAVASYFGTYDVDDYESFSVQCVAPGIVIDVSDESAASGKTVKRSKTAAQWANEASSPGILCSTLY